MPVYGKSSLAWSPGRSYEVYLRNFESHLYHLPISVSFEHESIKYHRGKQGQEDIHVMYSLTLYYRPSKTVGKSKVVPVLN
jgi:hypothetical protein